eukprot:CAMPEP_0202897344 /NCGR_PEP_ID=MMETSP1392-20130828/6130_1 /ASSEMBLY_ACC=CAM_ASM_000868 /TAXON_ID=225041 /ORGANISM="Chlamydomonas chlamydogama, Strain SAG 11-48b" /LENGTH=77 /DNA_ID=CAMNT_0049582953 /DNA_START=940 /DNA_END=1170 /DNA_ORIENTATION=-
MARHQPAHVDVLHTAHSLHRHDATRAPQHATRGLEPVQQAQHPVLVAVCVDKAARHHLPHLPPAPRLGTHWATQQHH